MLIAGVETMVSREPKIISRLIRAGLNKFGGGSPVIAHAEVQALWTSRRERKTAHVSEQEVAE
jgi:hypothetical protein